MPLMTSNHWHRCISRNESSAFRPPRLCSSCSPWDLRKFWADLCSNPSFCAFERRLTTRKTDSVTVGPPVLCSIPSLASLRSMPETCVQTPDFVHLSYVHTTWFVQQDRSSIGLQLTKWEWVFRPLKLCTSHTFQTPQIVHLEVAVRHPD